jgi:hypothetical protein
VEENDVFVVFFQRIPMHEFMGNMNSAYSVQHLHGQMHQQLRALRLPSGR